ncbi:beta-ketoacyl synthase N-terminal-like domain-containing protein [Paenibacillus massiliensis]|uniref:beta-ketoacyl synthase N-terminal-like domain-containing protein n=1 Tax=Paenibacillus massiliensis TaxID=225917 RepID=UPI0003728C54|nr:beta-ketoacyl synthase N-terminal-like domain-containing protein [Paenibacillus massiliensis]
MSNSGKSSCTELLMLSSGAVTPAGAGTRLAQPWLRRAMNNPTLSPRLERIPAEVTAIRLPGVRKWGRPSRMAYLAVAEALKGIELECPERTGMIIGGEYTNLEAILQLDEDAASFGVNGTNPAIFPETVLNVVGGHLAAQFGITGVNVTVSSGSRTGVQAFQYAADLLRLNLVDRIVVCIVHVHIPDKLTDYVEPPQASGEYAAAFLLQALPAECSWRDMVKEKDVDRLLLVPRSGDLMLCVAAEAEQLRENNRPLGMKSELEDHQIWLAYAEGGGHVVQLVAPISGSA